ncbi:hypothetical protein [Natranaerobius thermophilus]|uniref:Uncharacterized protein n=1 Tax=Natranaerobius thermophilus (strain ATCC BAA-1301 / DSM 18059 / JW/NM-WN-LF) TaxID=457570 RepID=B2A6F8_NATTJ|nr:hypothetical protein [Natranaerobius thermophilus]ACB85491.1 hypothetical protein Nther_1920 [Natranaerobius thermophilus JW/NM-WN-LF]
MSEKKYLLVMDCHGKEDHDGERWIDEQEFQRIKDRSKDGKVGLNCSECNLKIEDADGNIVFSHCEIK